MATIKRTSARAPNGSRVTRLYLLACTVASSIVFGYTAVAAVDRLDPHTAVNIQQMLEWHKEVAESIAPAVPGSISGVRAQP